MIPVTHELTLAVDQAARAVAGVAQLYAAKPVPHVAKQMTAGLIPALESTMPPAALSSLMIVDGAVDVLVSVGVSGDVTEVARSVAPAVRVALVAHGVDAGASEVHVRVSRVAASDLAAPGA